MYNTAIVPCEKSEIVSFASSIMKSIALLYLRFILELDVQ